jgi:1-phosphatidylinositol-4-phosphate 5-kinase
MEQQRGSHPNLRRLTTTTRQSIFSLPETPAIKILKRNELTSAGKLTGVVFWYHFRSWFPFLAFGLMLLFYLIPLLTVKNNQLPYYLIYGSILSTLMSLMVIISYFHIVPWRKHPSPLIFYRTFSHLLFSLVLILNSLEKQFDDGDSTSSSSDHNTSSAHNSTEGHSDTCHFLSFLTQFSFLSGETWLLTVAIDLYLSLTNPFTSYKSNLTAYHWLVWLIGFLNAFSLVLSNQCHGIFADTVCWIHVSSVLSPCLWGYYLSWVLVYYLLCIGVVSFASLRISRGLESTYESRKACVKSTFVIVISYILYSVLCFLIYVIVLAQNDFQSDLANHLKNLVAYLLALRSHYSPHSLTL